MNIFASLFAAFRPDRSYESINEGWVEVEVEVEVDVDVEVDVEVEVEVDVEVDVGVKVDVDVEVDVDMFSTTNFNGSFLVPPSTREAIKEIAHYIWEQGDGSNSKDDDWFQAKGIVEYYINVGIPLTEFLERNHNNINLKDESNRIQQMMASRGDRTKTLPRSNWFNEYIKQALDNLQQELVNVSSRLELRRQMVDLQRIRQLMCYTHDA